MSHQEHIKHQERQGHGRGAATGLNAATCATSCWSVWQTSPRTATSSIRALEERFHGFYSPSPGVVYPTLQWLEDLEYVTAAEADGRKVYTITEQGRSFLAAGGPRVAEIDQRLRGWMGPFDRREYRAEIEGIQDDLHGMAQALREAGSRADPERLRRVREVTQRARQEMEIILGELDSRPAQDKKDAERKTA